MLAARTERLRLCPPLCCTCTTQSICWTRVLPVDVPRKTYGGVNVPEADLEAARKAMQRAAELEGISYASLAEFVRDALRRRVEAINEAWRAAQNGRKEPGLPQPKRHRRKGA